MRNKRFIAMLSVFAMLFVGSTASVHAAEFTTNKNGEFWYDSNGLQMDVHGASMYEENNTYYLIGEKRVNGTSSYDNEFRGFVCYSSTDLKNWTYENEILAPDGTILKSTDVATRAKILYNAANNNYVMWFKWKEDGDNNLRKAAYATSDSVCGNYSFAGATFGNNGDYVGDPTLFLDDDGKAYLVYSAIDSSTSNRRISIDQLSSDFQSISTHITYTANGREAPNIFKKDNIYYLITSGASGWNPNQSKYYTASSLNGPWSAAANFGNATTYHSQGSDVAVIQGSSSTTYMFVADRWDSSYLGNSKNIWLPIAFSGTGISISNSGQWTIDTETGQWSAADWYDDFESGNASNWTVDSGSWSVVNDDTYVYKQARNNIAAVAKAGNSAWTDYSLEVDVKPLSFNGANAGININLRYTDLSNRYFVAITPDAIQLVKRVGGVKTVLQSAPATFQTDQIYKVKAEANDDSLKVWLNGSLLMSQTDSSLSSGQIALHTYYASSEFDHISVNLN
ncbi:family 43 glycosylhydrolase [Paenibacillus sp. HB172176]|uniref:family 43 glycosylhydrolase n=1 Tax=Paenibacillus sp. HB172176 TaxID=2493690 RepID=UPI001439F4D2|nr:family 43 glycosylhydrolase [Paenibacillus sp. HB172176]